MKVINDDDDGDAKKFTAWCLLLNRRRRYEIEIAILFLKGGVLLTTPLFEALLFMLFTLKTWPIPDPELALP